MIVHINDHRNSTRVLQMISTFTKVAGFKINSKKLVALLYTNDKLSEKKVKEMTHFTIVTNSIKYLIANLTK